MILQAAPRTIRSGILPARALLLALCCGAFVGCDPGTTDHPWFDLADHPGSRIVQFSEGSPGQTVVVMEPPVTQEDALALGRAMRSQAPEGALLNVRIYDDEQTARSWSTAPAPQTLQHLLVVVQVVPSTGLDEVRWVRSQSPEGGL